MHAVDIPNRQNERIIPLSILLTAREGIKAMQLQHTIYKRSQINQLVTKS